MAKLVYQDQHGRERSVEIGRLRSHVTVGRNADCIIQTNNASVSREHAVLFHRDGTFMVQDPPPGPPTNGTYVNGRRLQPGEVVNLNDQDEIRCGNFAIFLYLEESDRVPQQVQSYDGFENSYNQYVDPYQQQPQQQQQQQNWQHPQDQGWSQQPHQQTPQPQQPVYEVQQPAALAQPLISQEELEELKRENVSLKAVEQRQREQIEQLQHTTLDQERVLADFERRANHHNNVVEGLNDKIARLKEQLDLQKEQLQTYRDELKSAQEQKEDLEFKLDSLQSTMSNSDAATASAESQLADLKVQINQRDRRIDDLQRELDLSQYAVTTEKENVERLESTLSQVNNQVEGFERFRRDMAKVVEQHEITIEELRRGLDESEREKRQLLEQIRLLERGQGSQSQTQLAQLREELNNRNNEIRLLEDQLRNAEKHISKLQASSGSSQEVEKLKSIISELEAELDQARLSGGGNRRDLVRQLNELKRDKRDLKMELEAARNGAPAAAAPQGDPNAERKIAALERELDDAKLLLAEAKQSMARRPSRDFAAGGQSPQLDAIRKRSREVYQAINDVVSQWRNDMQILDDYIQDIQRVFEILEKTDLAELRGASRGRLESALQEIDPQMTFDEINELISSNQRAISAVKSSLRDLREVVL